MRQSVPLVLGVLIRRYGRFDECEDAVQEALLEASVQWPSKGLPDNPKAWLITVASRRLMDLWRSDIARRKREETVGVTAPSDHFTAPGPDEVSEDSLIEEDDTLRLLYMCCHPSLSPASQVALTLRAVGGLTTAEIASAFLVPEATLAQRISRAKQRIKTSGIPFQMPDSSEVVLQVLYLIFNEGYTATSGPALQRVELTSEAIRLTRAVHQLLPDDGEVAGLLALMLLTNARRRARSTSDGSLIPLAEQDRTLWDRSSIQEGTELISAALASSPLGQYQIQAAIAAVHAEAERPQDTDWPQILALYQLFDQLTPNPMVTLNHAVALAMVKGPQAGLAMLDGLESDERMAASHRLDAVKAHLLEMAGDSAGARDRYLSAARRTTSLPERRYLEGKAASIKQ